MSGWKFYALHELADITMGQSPKGESCNFSGEGMPFLNGPTEFTQRFPIPKQYTSDPKRVAQINDLLWCVRGSTVGKRNFANQKYAIGRGLASIRSKFGPKHTEFIGLLLDYKLSEILSASSGSTFPNVSREHLSNLKFYLPDIDTQHYFTEVLTSLDDKIEINQRMNRTLEEMAMTFYKHWFVDFGPFRDCEFVGSEMGSIPKEWRVDKLGEHVNIFRGASPRPITEPKYFSNGTIPWIKIADATASNSIYLSKTKEFCTDLAVTKSRFVEAGSLILSNSATVGIPKILNLSGCIHDGWLSFNQYRNITRNYLFYALIFNYQMLFQVADGTVQKNLNTTILKNMNIVVPDRKTVDEFDSKIQELFDMILSNEKESNHIIQTRDYLLFHLLSGGIETKVVEKQIEGVL